MIAAPIESDFFSCEAAALSIRIKRLSVSPCVRMSLFPSPLIVCPRGTNIFHTQVRGGDKHFLRKGGGGQTFLPHRGGQTFLHWEGGQTFYVEDVGGDGGQTSIYIKRYVGESVSESVSNVLFVPRGTNIFHTQVRCGGDKQF